MTRRSRTRGVAILVVVAAVAVAAVLVLRSDAHSDSPAATRNVGHVTPTPTASTSAPPATEPPAASADPTSESAPFPVDRVDVVLVDPALGDRSVRVTIWYPLRSGPQPLVVFAHGYATTPDTYEPFLAGLASTGYVVAAPRSYATRAYVGGGDVAVPAPDEPAPDGPQASALRFVDDDTPPAADEPTDQPADETGPTVVFDFDDQRRDLVAVMDVLLGADAPSEVQGHIAPGKVGVIGHSDGGVSAAAVAFNSVVGDGRVGAAVIASGDYGYFGGSWFPEGSPALLALHGDADGINPVSSSVRLFYADADSPRYLVIAHGAGHLGLLLDDPPATAVINLVSDFFRGFLRDDTTARAHIETDADGGLLDLVDAG
jgi:dienelactone hydrolase